MTETKATVPRRGDSCHLLPLRALSVCSREPVGNILPSSASGTHPCPSTHTGRTALPFPFGKIYVILLMWARGGPVCRGIKGVYNDLPTLHTQPTFDQVPR